MKLSFHREKKNVILRGSSTEKKKEKFLVINAISKSDKGKARSIGRVTFSQSTMLAPTIYVALLLAVRAQPTRKIWLTKVDQMNFDLAGVQAVVVKDENVPADDGSCRADGGDARYSWVHKEDICFSTTIRVLSI